MRWQHSWQYNGVAPWNDIYEWCFKNFPGQWYTNDFETIHFRDESAYLVFLLRWA